MVASYNAQELDMKPPNPAVSMPVSSSMLYNMINAAAVATTSTWIPFQPFSRLAIEVIGSGTFSVQLVGSCSLDNPSLNSLSGSNLGSAITTAGITFADYSGVRWLQVQLTAADAAVTVNVSAVAP